MLYNISAWLARKGSISGRPDLCLCRRCMSWPHHKLRIHTPTALFFRAWCLGFPHGPWCIIVLYKGFIFFFFLSSLEIWVKVCSCTRDARSSSIICAASWICLIASLPSLGDVIHFVPVFLIVVLVCIEGPDNNGGQRASTIFLSTLIVE